MNTCSTCTHWKTFLPPHHNKDEADINELGLCGGIPDKRSDEVCTCVKWK
jgi:hypothetical protein